MALPWSALETTTSREASAIPVYTSMVLPEKVRSMARASVSLVGLPYSFPWYQQMVSAPITISEVSRSKYERAFRRASEMTMSSGGSVSRVAGGMLSLTSLYCIRKGIPASLSMRARASECETSMNMELRAEGHFLSIMAV